MCPCVSGSYSLVPRAVLLREEAPKETITCSLYSNHLCLTFHSQRMSVKPGIKEFYFVLCS